MLGFLVQPIFFNLNIRKRETVKKNFVDLAQTIVEVTTMFQTNVVLTLKLTITATDVYLEDQILLEPA